MQIRNLCKFEPAGQTAYCIGFLAMKIHMIQLMCTLFRIQSQFGVF